MRAVNWGKVLYCEECGCCSDTGRGWIGQIAFDPEDGEPPKVIVFCPPCAASEFEYRPDVAADYACDWDPLPSDTDAKYRRDEL
jgi:hypothetical protein